MLSRAPVNPFRSIAVRSSYHALLPPCPPPTMPSLQAPKTVPRKKRKGAPTSGSDTAPSPASTAPTVEELLSGDEEEEEEEEEDFVEVLLASHFDEPEGGVDFQTVEVLVPTDHEVRDVHGNIS